jgi:Cellulase (glycosyl hydrolase family 5)
MVLRNKAIRGRVVRSALGLGVVGAVCVLAATAAASTVAKHSSLHVVTTPTTIPLRTAILDALFSSASPDRQEGLDMAHGAGATYVRLPAAWNDIAPSSPPSGFVATDPTSVGYSWTELDSVVENAETAGLTPILDITGPPNWADTTQPSGVNAGTPSISALGQFATALATHYDGSVPGVPVVHVFQVWNEPNVSVNLGPVDPAVYRDMVNAVADSVHAVDPSNLVVAGGLDPFGHPPSNKQKWYSTTPMDFMRAVLCLSAGAHPHRTCNAQIHFDVWSHHPYTFGGPFGHSKNKDDVSLGNIGTMHSLLEAGVRLHAIVSTQPVQFWVTEFGWDTKPPRSGAASVPLASRWTSESLYQMWRNGVSLVTWFLLQDYKSPSKYQSGLYFYAPTLAGAKPKPVLTAYRFPFVAYLGKKNVTIWGRDGTSNAQLVKVQLRTGTQGTWQTVGLVRANQYGIFKASLKLQATKTDWLRAVAPASGDSLAFSLTRPKTPHVGPWGS